MRGENDGETMPLPFLLLLGRSSGDTEEEEYMLSADPARTSGDVGESGAGGICDCIDAFFVSAVLRSLIHCSR